MARAATFILNAIRERERVNIALSFLFPDTELPVFSVRSRHGSEHLNLLHWTAVAEWLKERVEESLEEGDENPFEPVPPVDDPTFTQENGDEDTENDDEIDSDEDESEENGDEENDFPVSTEDEEPDFLSMNREQLRQYTEAHNIPVKTTGMNDYTTRKDYLKALGIEVE